MVRVDAQTRELLTWLESRDVRYAEAIETWHSHCPRLTTWEDALLAGYIRIGPDKVVRVTDDGRAASRVSARVRS